MNNPLHFFVELLKQPLWVVTWVAFMGLVNMMSLLFWQDRLAKIIAVTFMISAGLMMSLYSVFGFQKTLGLGHILWLALLPYVLIQLKTIHSKFKIYLLVWAFTTSVSLAFDITDVYFYFCVGAVQ